MANTHLLVFIIWKLLAKKILCIFYEKSCVQNTTNTILHQRIEEITFTLNIKPKKCHLKESSGCGVKGLEGTLQNNEASN